MTQASKLKQRIRERSARTGERYAVARRHVLAKVEAERQARTASAAQKARSTPSTGAVSEAKCTEKTGYGFDYWFEVLDRFRAPTQGHTAAARHLQRDHGVSAWYAQAITVSYERARGLRTLNQTTAGGYQVSVSRVLPVALDVAVGALTRKAHRERWVPDHEPAGQALADALTARRMKRGSQATTLRFSAEGATVELRLTPKGDDRATVQVSVSKLANDAAVQAARAAWRYTLDVYRQYLRQLS